MANLETSYLGLTLKNPIIIGSSGLTKNIEGVKKAVASGAGAVILKSLFEEQIMANSLKDDFNHPEAYAYMQSFGTVEYLNLIQAAKKVSTIPIIASINCFSDGGWIDYAKQIEQAGADALELNIMSIPTKKFFVEDRFEKNYYDSVATKPRGNASHTLSGEEIEATLFEVVQKIKSALKIPIAVKIGAAYTSVLNVASELDKIGIDGLVMFNSGFVTDLDLENMQLIPKINFSTQNDMYNAFRWTALLANDLKADVCASTGIHSADSVLKMIYAGASTVQVCSLLYKEGFSSIQPILDKMNLWLDGKSIKSLSAIRGTLAKNVDTTKFGRLQYMKLSAGLE